MPVIQYTTVRDEPHLQGMINTLKKYARTHPLDYQEMLAVAESGGGKMEKTGMFVRVQGASNFDYLKSYTIFISFDGKTPLQVSYYEYTKVEEDKRVCQLTVIDNNQNQLDDNQVMYLCHIFLGEEWFAPPNFDKNAMPHVAIAFKVEDRFDPTVN